MKTRDGRSPRLAAIKREARTCIRCRDLDLLFQNDDGRWAYPLFHEESECSAGIVFVLEAPNYDDTFNPAKGRLTCDPTTDPTGQFMHDLLASVGLNPGDVLFTNGVLCLPAKKGDKFPVKAEQRDQCRPWLERLIQDVNPSVVSTFGTEALAAVSRIDRHGLTLKAAAGRLHSWYGRYLLPLYHPSRLGRVTRSEALQREDIRALVPYLESIGWPKS